MGFQNLRVRYSWQQRHLKSAGLSAVFYIFKPCTHFNSDIVSKCFQFSHYFDYFHYFQSHSATGFLALFRQKSFRKAWTFPLQRRQRMHQLLQQQQKRQLKRPCWAVPCCACLKTETVSTMGWHGDGMGMAWGISHPHFLEPLGAGCVRWTSALCHLGTCWFAWPCVPLKSWQLRFWQWPGCDQNVTFGWPLDDQNDFMGFWLILMWWLFCLGTYGRILFTL